jgi:tRNA nucleotidyltransferase (CCA-adding enzyme)
MLCDYGSNTTYFALELAESGIDIHHDDATIALTAIYSDTGSFMHDNVKDADFNAAAYLLQNGASISVVKKLLSPLKEEHQLSLFHRLINEMIYQDFRGHMIGLSYIELENRQEGSRPSWRRPSRLEHRRDFRDLFDEEGKRRPDHCAELQGHDRG